MNGRAWWYLSGLSAGFVIAAAVMALVATRHWGAGLVLWGAMLAASLLAGRAAREDGAAESQEES